MKMTVKLAIPVLLLMLTSAGSAYAQGNPGGGFIWAAVAGAAVGSAEKEGAGSIAADNLRVADSAIQSEMIRSAAVTWFVKSDGAKAD